MQRSRQMGLVLLSAAAVVVAGLWAFRLATGRLPWQGNPLPTSQTQPAGPATPATQEPAAPPQADAAPQADTDRPRVRRVAVRPKTFLGAVGQKISGTLWPESTLLGRLSDAMEESWGVQLLRGELLMAAGDAPAAQRRFQRVCDLAPKRAAGFDKLALMAVSRGELDPAAALYQKALALEPDNVQVICHYATLFGRKGEHYRAEELFRRALRLDPKCLAARGNLAAIVNAKGYLGEARYLWEQVVATDPTFPNAQYNLGLVYYELKQYDDAIKQFDAVLSRSPRDADAMNNLGLAYQAKGGETNDAMALAYYQRAYEHSPSNLVILNNLADFHRTLHERDIIEQKHLKMMIILYRQSLALDPKQPRIADTLRYYESLAPRTEPTSAPDTLPSPGPALP